MEGKSTRWIGVQNGRKHAGGVIRRDNGLMDAECAICKGARWVCEDHIDKPWSGASDAPDACHCGGAGAPCPACNPCDAEHKPEMPEGYKSIIDARDSWTN